MTSTKSFPSFLEYAVQSSLLRRVFLRTVHGAKNTGPAPHSYVEPGVERQCQNRHMKDADFTYAFLA